MEPGSVTRPSIVGQRCDRVRETISLRQLFDQLGWDAPERGRIRCLWPDHDDEHPAMQPYWDTNSVHCFACGKSGGVIELVRHAVPPTGGSWTLDQALDWLEKTFGLPALTPAESLKSRLKKVLVGPGQGVSPSGQSVGRWTAARTAVRDAFDTVERSYPRAAVLSVSGQRDYIWAQEEGFATDAIVWASWARTMIFGSYENRLRAVANDLAESSLDVPPLPDVWYDDETTCDSYWLWDTHREHGMIDDQIPVSTVMF